VQWLKTDFFKTELELDRRLPAGLQHATGPAAGHVDG
jgi:hypothetical protein